MEIVGFDAETAEKPNHFPWFKGHYLSVVSLSFPNNTVRSWIFIHNQNATIDVTTYQDQLIEIETELNKYDILAAHNLKFDLNQLRELKVTGKLHCTMVAEYLLTFQERNGLKLDDLSVTYGLPLKIDKVKIMWDAGKETREIPLSLLVPYCEEDARKARIIAEKQQYQLRIFGMMKNFNLQMDWLNILSLMECTGIDWDGKKAQEIINTYRKYQVILTAKITKFLGRLFPKDLNLQFTSGDELSAMLYGGDIKRKEKKPVIRTKNVKVQMPYIFTYKNGKQRIKPRWNSHPDTKIIRMVFKDVYYNTTGLRIEPLKKTELAKSTPERPYYKTDKDTLPFLKVTTLTQKRVIKLLNKLSSVNKVITTFVNEDKGTGLVNKVGVDGRLHTNYNQAITTTGCLSSSDPNSQNLPRGNTSPIKTCFKG